MRRRSPAASTTLRLVLALPPGRGSTEMSETVGDRPTDRPTEPASDPDRGKALVDGPQRAERRRRPTLPTQLESRPVPNPKDQYLRLTRVRFRSGAAPDADGAVVTVSDVNIVVGPNNSGKSLALREIFGWASQGGQPPQPWLGGSVIADCEGIWPPTIEKLEAFLKPRALSIGEEDAARLFSIHSYPLEQQPGPGQGQGGRVNFTRPNPGQDFAEYCRTQVLPHYTARLDGQSRFGLSQPRTLTTLREPPSNHFMALLRSPELFQQVDRTIAAAFGLHLVVDATQPPNLQMALSNTAPPEHWQDRLMSQDVIDYQARARPIHEFSDGVKVYAGLVSAVHSLPHRLLLLDEPEAFLHPTLARRLGSEIASVVRDRRAVLVAATHSPEFLLGCLGEVPEATIIRLTYENEVATTRTLAGDAVAALVREPLLRAADALSALFARGAVVCEADSDRAFYDEINRRLQAAPSRVSSDDTVFLNAQNWQTTTTIAAPLRALGIPAAVVLDLDVLLQDGFKDLVAIAGLDNQTANDLHAERQACRAILEDMGTLGNPPNEIRRCKVDGVAGIEDAADRARVEAFLATLADIGLFLVPVGEIEKWLTQFNLTNKQTWVTDMLKHLGSVGSAAYVTPGDGDVWEFVEGIARWIQDPRRRGIAS